MFKYRILFIFLITSYIFTYGQNNNDIDFSGCIFDSATNKSISYVNIYLKKSGLGIVSNVEGKYQFHHNNLKDTITFSFIGYKSVDIELVDLQNMNEIYLHSESYSIEEVQVQAKRRDYKTKELGNFSKKIGNCKAFSTGLKPKLKIENSYDGKDVRIRAIKFTIRKSHGTPLPIRINLYRIDENGKKGKPLLLDDLIYQDYSAERIELVKIDITNKNIKLPSEGVYVELQALNVGSSFGSIYSCCIGIDRQFGKLQIGLEVDVFKNL